MNKNFGNSNLHVVLWGLKHKRDSFRFIFQGFYDALLKEGVTVSWVEDSPKSEGVIRKDSIVIGVDVASKHFAVISGPTYVTLNIQPESETGKKLSKQGNWFKIQEFTNRSPGELDSEGSIARFKLENRTLYMPWGTPASVDEFKKPLNLSLDMTKEYWVGAIWNDALNQGNTEAIETYRQALTDYGIRFKRIGGSRWRVGGLSEEQNAIKVRESRLGAAIVGNWQKENQYYPCRIFKAVSAGVPPTSNLDAHPVFRDSLLYQDDITKLVQHAMAESANDRIERTLSAQKLIERYTYKASFERILRMINADW